MLFPRNRIGHPPDIGPVSVTFSISPPAAVQPHYRPPWYFGMAVRNVKEVRLKRRKMPLRGVLAIDKPGVTVIGVRTVIKPGKPLISRCLKTIDKTASRKPIKH